MQKQKPQRVKAIYDCFADNPDELTFYEGEVIEVEGEEDSEWWVSKVTLRHDDFAECVLSCGFCVFQLGHIEGDPTRRGVFPVTFVHFFTD